MERRILLAQWGFVFGLFGAVLIRSHLAGVMTALDREILGWCAFGFCLLALWTLKVEGK